MLLLHLVTPEARCLTVSTSSSGSALNLGPVLTYTGIWDVGRFDGLTAWIEVDIQNYNPIETCKNVQYSTVGGFEFCKKP
jgi:hypothetical protein